MFITIELAGYNRRLFSNSSSIRPHGYQWKLEDPICPIVIIHLREEENMSKQRSGIGKPVSKSSPRYKSLFKRIVSESIVREVILKNVIALDSMKGEKWDAIISFKSVWSCWLKHARNRPEGEKMTCFCKISSTSSILKAIMVYFKNHIFRWYFGFWMHRLIVKCNTASNNVSPFVMPKCNLKISLYSVQNKDQCIIVESFLVSELNYHFLMSLFRNFNLTFKDEKN